MGRDGTPAATPAVRITAEKLADKQHEISVTEFFEKNKQVLGFDSRTKSLLMGVKEAVDNSLDACEESEFLPDIIVKITNTGEEEYKVSIEDNGPGIVHRAMPNVFGRLLYGSRFHALRQSRGQQGIGISATVMFANISTGRPAHVASKTEGLDAADKAQALEKIKSIRARVVAAGDPGEVGQAFTKAAQEHSDCPSGAQGGSLGWFGRGMMVPEFDQAAFGMKCGEVSDVIETQFGYHIILKTDEKAGGPQTLVDVADQIRDLLRHEARGRAMDAYVAELREKVTIEYR